MKTLYLLGIVFVISSCIRENRFLIIRDADFMEPAYRFERVVANDSLYGLHERYFVFNYSYNERMFDSASIKLLCESLNDSLLVSFCSFDFQDMDNWWGKYDERDALGADFTKTIVVYTWDISQPRVLVASWGEIPNETRELIPFDCLLNRKYEKLIHEKQ